jgi:hypothetical protein
MSMANVRVNRTAMASRCWHPKTSLRRSPAPRYGSTAGAAAVGPRGQRHHPSPSPPDVNIDEVHITADVGRPTFATTLIRGGTDLVAVADMLGRPASTPFASTPTPAPPAAKELSISMP